jgi:antitoxin component YwqK of YwqJK toxin-antitoxin module
MTVWRALAGAGFYFLMSAGALAVQDCELGGQSVSPANGQTTAGKTGLMRCKDRDSGLLAREQELQGGKFMGVVRYFDKGVLTQEHSMNEAGNRHGRAREFDRSGQLISDQIYDNGSTVGLAQFFHRNGQLRRVVFYARAAGEQASAEFNQRGQLQSLRCGDQPQLAPAVDDARLCGFAGGASQVELFGSSGTLAGRGSYLAGRRVREDAFFDNGQLQYQSEVSGDTRIERFFTSTGVKRRELQSVASGKTSFARVREQDFAESGVLTRDRRWSPLGWAVRDERFFLNGQPKEKIEFGGAGADGRPSWQQATTFHDNGKPAFTGRFQLGSRTAPTGAHQSFDENGRLVAESLYDDTGRITREKAWDERGRLLRDNEVFEDGSRK